MSAYWYVSIANACFWLKPARWGILLVEEELSHIWPTARHPANELNSGRFDIYVLHSYSQVVNGETRRKSSMTLDKVWKNCIFVWRFTSFYGAGHQLILNSMFLSICIVIIVSLSRVNDWAKCPVFLLRSVYVCKFYILFYSVRSEGKQDHVYSGC